MRSLALFFLALLTGAGLAHADSGVTEITAIIQHQASAIAAVDAEALKTDWVEGGSIIDNFAPYYWTGPGFQAAWIKGFSDGVSQGGLKNLRVRVKKALQVLITGDAAYATCPVKVSWTAKGKRWNEDGIWTMALKQTDAGWRIVSWAWGGPAPTSH
jgi:ketosteroid isomerase-like protein